MLCQLILFLELVFLERSLNFFEHIVGKIPNILFKILNRQKHFEHFVCFYEENVRNISQLFISLTFCSLNRTKLL